MQYGEANPDPSSLAARALPTDAAHPHLLIDLNGLLVLLQLRGVGSHLQQTLVGRAAINSLK